LIHLAFRFQQFLCRARERLQFLGREVVVHREAALGKESFLCRAAAIETVAAASAPTMSFGELPRESGNIAKCPISLKRAARRMPRLPSGARSSTSTNALAHAKMKIDAKGVILGTTSR
jgi:hypothetical protein